MEPPEDSLPTGFVVGDRYRIIRKIGAGGMGAVYAAQQLGLGRLVALKVILAEYTADEILVERFRREARLIASIHHPNIVEVFDPDEANGTWFLAMELLDGLSLSDAIDLQGTYEPAGMVPVLDGILAGLEVAHGRQLVHRDLKPGNIFLARTTGDDLRVKILDFGVAKSTDESAQARLTRTGTVLGTPEYMAPEQATGGSADARADLYALGCIAKKPMPLYVERTIVALPRIYINGGARGFLVEIDPALLVTVLHAEPVDIATMS